MIVLNLHRAVGPAPCWGAGTVGIEYPAPRQVGFGYVTGAGGVDGQGIYRGDSEPAYVWAGTGDPVPPDEAVAIGLANFVVPADHVVAEAIAFAHRLAALPPQAVQDTKAVLNQHLFRLHQRTPSGILRFAQAVG